MSENKDKYHDTVLDLEARAKKNEDVVLKIGNSLQGMFMLGPKPISFYDSKVKHGLGYTNPYTLKKAISQNPKLYDASCLDDSKIHVNVRDTEDILDDATKNFVPQKEFSAEQKYFLFSFISFENSSNASSPSSSSETKPTVTPMPSANPMKLDLNKMENEFQKLFALLQTNSKRESIFYTSPEEIRLTKFCQQEVKPILHKLHLSFEIFQKRFLKDIKEIKDVFDSTENDLSESWTHNELLQLLEAKLKHEIECCVLLSHECVNNNVQDEIEQFQRESIEIQEGMQKRINILENDMEKLESENVFLEFQVQSLINERENVKSEYQKLFNSIKKTRSQTQGEINELIENVNQKTYAYANVRAQNQDLLMTITDLKTKLKNAEKGKSVNTKFDKINVSNQLLCDTPQNKKVFHKKTIAPKTEEKHVLSKIVTLQTSPTKKKEVETNQNVIAPGMYKVTKQTKTNTKRAKSVLPSTGLSAASSVRRPLNRDSPLKNSVLSNTKKSSEKVEVSVRKNKKTYVSSKNVVSNKKIVTDMDVENALKAKDVLCVSCAKNVLIPCHDKCLANYKLNVPSKVRRALFTTSRIVKSKLEDTTHVVSETRFSVKTTQSKSLDTTPVVSKTKIDVVTPLSAKNKVVQIVPWIVDNGCSKHMMGDRSLLENFVEKFMGTVRFGNDHFAAIIGYGDYIQGNIIVCHVYYVEGLGYNLFSVGQFCDGDLEVAFRSNTCYVRNLEGDDLLTGARESNLYTISISDMAASSPVCLMSKATSTKSWLWHHRLSHLNFGTINDLTKHDLVDGLLKFKYGKDHLCSACE
ncbi:integrase, catalytic region, zinc finger, CCHC-type containing protein [Tanacetum coccineum]